MFSNKIEFGSKITAIVVYNKKLPKTMFDISNSQNRIFLKLFKLILLFVHLLEKNSNCQNSGTIVYYICFRILSLKITVDGKTSREFWFSIIAIYFLPDWKIFLFSIRSELITNQTGFTISIINPVSSKL